MTAEVQPGQARYRAFISYSHKDVGWARLLHRRLEAYRMPRRLVGVETAMGPVPARLTPIFRDRDELPAAGDLSEQVRAALARSDSLIVICSPDARASPWVAREIDLFRALHPERPILAAVVRGEPGECFPEPLIGEGADGRRVEPLAADLRKEGDGLRLGLLKLVAGVTGVGLDSLVQRDAQRKLRRVTAVTVGALFGMLAMGLLAIVALNARAEAERQRGQAEGLIEFMLTDLREKLEGVGRLDVLTAANERALAYYAGQDLRGLPPDALARRARILLALGEDDQAREDAASALANFTEARRTTAILLADAPRDPDIVFTHAQAEFWLGSLAWEREDFATAAVAFRRYATLADRLMAIAPGEVRSVKEVAYATGNLCSLSLEADQAQESIALCNQALRAMEATARMVPADASVRRDVANRHAWLADAYRELGDFDAARRERSAEARILTELRAADPKNAKLERARIWSERALAGLEYRTRASGQGRARLRRAIIDLEALSSADPENQMLVEELQRMRREMANRAKRGEES